MTHHRITPAISLMLALAAGIPPIASADPPPLAQAEAAIAHATTGARVTPASCGDVCSGHGYGQANVTTGARVTPASCGDVCSGHGYGQVNVTTGARVTPASCGDVCSGHGYDSVTAPATIVRVVAPGGGFDWGDAGIGAGGALALTLTGLGGVLAISRRRSRATRRPAYPTT